MTDSVTVSLLPVSLSIVHIPRSRLHSLCHPLLRQILLPKPTFLNITCNELELSLFAEHHVIKDFEPIAQKDARKQRVRGRDPLVSSKGGPSLVKHNKSTWEPIEISSEKWNVLQIDSHSDTLGEVTSKPVFTLAPDRSASRQVGSKSARALRTLGCRRHIYPLSILLHE